MAWEDLAFDISELFSDLRLEVGDLTVIRPELPEVAVERNRRWRALNRSTRNARDRARYAEDPTKTLASQKKRHEARLAAARERYARRKVGV